MWSKISFVVEVAGESVRDTQLVQAQSEAAAVHKCLTDLTKLLQSERPAWRDDLQLVRVQAVA